MVHATVEDFIASFPPHILPTVQGGAYHHTIHSIRKLLRANARSIESHLGGGDRINRNLRNHHTCSPVGERHRWVAAAALLA
jgi:hypothetical protein